MGVRKCRNRSHQGRQDEKFHLQLVTSLQRILTTNAIFNTACSCTNR
jgi:hypothetical protein